MLFAPDSFGSYENQSKTMNIKLVYQQLNTAHMERNIFQFLVYDRLSINGSC